MKIASTILQVREAKSENAVKIGANAANNNGANTNTNSNAVTAQSKVVKTDTVEVSKKSVELAATTATKSEKVQESVDKLAEANKKATAAEKSTDAGTNYRQAMMKGQNELKSVVKDLKEAGVGRREIGKVIRTANREANKTIGTEIRQAYQDYRGKKIDRNEFTNKLYGSAVKKLDSIVSGLRDALAQKVAPADKNTEAVKENANATKSDNVTKETAETKVTDADDASKANAEKSAEAAKESANATKSDEATGATKETKVTDADDASKAAAKENTEKTKKAASETSEKEVKTESGNVVKAEKTETVSNSGQGKGLGILNSNGNGIGSGPGSINANENADKEFSRIVDFFNNIDKMINGFADVDGDEVEVKGSNDKEKGDSLVRFASKLNDMFSGINKAFGRHENDNVGSRLGMAQVKKETISQLFNSGHGSGGAINRIGDAGEGSGSFNAVSFMSSMSSGINEGLESYKDVQKAEKESKEEAAKEEAAGVLA